MPFAVKVKNNYLNFCVYASAEYTYGKKIQILVKLKKVVIIIR